MTVEYKFKSRRHYDAYQKDPAIFGDEAKSASGWLSFRRTNEPVLTVEVDEHSVFLALQEWGALVEHGLGAFAKAHTDVVATMYAYHTGPSPSVNASDGDHHREFGWHNACFLGVVGRDKANIRDAISNALTAQAGVPEEIVEARLRDRTKLKQVSCRNPSDYIPLRQFRSTPAWHIEDGRCWAPADNVLWFTRESWSA